jgi:hypothetical protein
MNRLLPILARKPSGRLDFISDDGADRLEVVSHILSLQLVGVTLLFTHCFTPVYPWYPHGNTPHTYGITSIYPWHYQSHRSSSPGALAFARATGLFTFYDSLKNQRETHPKKTSAPKAPAFSPTVDSPYLSSVAYMYPKESKTILIKNLVCLLLET